MFQRLELNENRMKEFMDCVDKEYLDFFRNKQRIKQEM